MGGGAPDRETHLEDVVSGLHIGYVNPLAVDVRVVSVIAAGAQALGKGTGVKAGVLGTPQSHPATPAIWAPPSSLLEPAGGRIRLKIGRRNSQVGGTEGGGCLESWMEEQMKRQAGQRDVP